MLKAKRVYNKKWAQEYYKKNKESILEKAKTRYAKKASDEKQKVLKQAKQRRAVVRKERIKALREQGINHKDKYAKARSLGYRSMFEVAIAQAIEENGFTAEYEPHYIPYIIKGQYKPDFQLPNGVLVEAKGYLDAGTCRKMLSVKASNPDLDIRFVFQRANGKRNKRAKLTNWEWAERHGFPWSEGTIPLEWFREEKKNG